MSFSLLKYYMRLMGLMRSNFKKHSLALNIILISFLINFFVSTLWFFLATAKTFIEYSKCFYYMISQLLVLLWHFIYFWYGREYVRVFTDFDAIVERSKLKNERKIHRFSNLFLFLNILFQLIHINKEAKIQKSAKTINKHRTKLSI